MAVCIAVQFSSQCIVQKLVVWRFPKHARKHAYPRDKLCGLRYISPQLSLQVAPFQALPILAKETTAATELAALDFASQLWIFQSSDAKTTNFIPLIGMLGLHTIAVYKPIDIRIPKSTRGSPNLYDTGIVSADLLKWSSSCLFSSLFWYHCWFLGVKAR